MNMDYLLNYFRNDYFINYFRNKESCSFTSGFLCTNTGKHHRNLTEVIFHQKNCDRGIVLKFYAIWFKVINSKKGPPIKRFFERVCDARLGLNIGADQYLGLKPDEFRWAIIHPPP